MSGLPALLAQVAATYDDLVDAALPGRGDPDERPPSDPLHKPAPGSLSVIDHRHKLLRGLRWWVHAVRDPDDPRRVVASDVRWLCSYLHGHLDLMAPEDRDELTANLSDWLHDAYPFMGRPDPAPLELPADAWDRRVRVADAAALLGCTVRTVQRRVPAGQRTDGMVVLGDAARCPKCDLLPGQCEHTRTVSA